MDRHPRILELRVEAAAVLGREGEPDVYRMLLDRAIRKRFIRYGLIASPVIALYVAAGVTSKSQSMVFLPVQRVLSVATQVGQSLPISLQPACSIR